MPAAIHATNKLAIRIGVLLSSRDEMPAVIA